MADLLGRLQQTLASRYRIERELGAGGMAVVFLAEDLRHRRQVALKVLRPELAAEIGPERFVREIETVAGLSHPHILPLLDSGAAGELLYYAMPYVEGESLRGRLAREKQLPLADALQIAREVADALSYAHGHAVVHRDIKPENILVQSGHAVVTDFGIARAITAAGGALTATGIALGTPAYMSPEQVAGSRDVDGRSDLYSLGCVLYEMLAGQPPFTGPTEESLAHQHLSVTPRPVSDLRPAVPGGVAAAIQRALAKTPADRQGTAALFAAALADREPGAAGASQPGAPASPARRGWRLVWLAAAAVVVAAGALFVLRPGRRAPVAVAPAHARSEIAVLPFQNLSTEGPYAYFAGGLHDELLTQLAKVAALKVISRTSVMGYQGASMPPLRQIAAELGVGSVVEGSVQVVRERLRVTVQLIDATTDEHLWAEQYDRTLDDAFAIQSEVAQQIVAAVGAALTSDEQGRLTAAPTANAEAYRLYLQGREYYSRAGFHRQDRLAAQQLYEQALALDPDFALAHAALSLVHGQMHFVKYDPSAGRVTRQSEEAEAALRLAPDLPEAHNAMGRAHYQARHDYRRALEEYSIALKGLPNDAELLWWIGSTHRRLGNWNECMAAYGRAAQLDPRKADLFYAGVGQTFRYLRRYADAVRAYDRALSLAPDLYDAAILRGWTYARWQGQLDTLRATLSRVPMDAELAFHGSPAVVRADLFLWERNADSLLQLVQGTSADVFEGRGFYLPRAAYAGWAHRVRGEHAAARAAFDSARVRLDAVLRELPDDWRAHGAHGLALAGLGRREEALREARWLQQTDVYREDAFDGPTVREYRAWILAQAGDADAALDEIERLLAEPSTLSVHALQLDPLWDPIRAHPRFKALLVKYGSGAAQ
ncbi:MAG TPA: protein kinase [Candidatus Eisenbacteria bacterium]